MYNLSKRVSKELYSSTVVLKAAYSFLERCYIHIEDDGSDWFISAKLKDEAEFSEQLMLELENELIAQAVRERVITQTKSIREILMARAMSSTLIDTEDSVKRIKEESGDISDDELKSILTSWFDKNERA